MTGRQHCSHCSGAACCTSSDVKGTDHDGDGWPAGASSWLRTSSTTGARCPIAEPHTGTPQVGGDARERPSRKIRPVKIPAWLRRNLAVGATRARVLLGAGSVLRGGVVSPGSKFPRRAGGLFRVWRRSSLEEAPHGDIGGAA